MKQNGLFPVGNPSTSTDANPVITYDKTGSYDVTLIVKNAFGADTLKKTAYVVVIDEAMPDFSQSIAGFDVQFTDLSMYAESWEWDFGDGSGVSNEQHPLHSYGQEGEYDVTLKVTNFCGSMEYVKKVAVYLIPKVDFGSDKIVICGRGSIQFEDRSSVDVLKWEWDFGEGEPATSTEQHPIVHFSKPGFYSVKLEVQNSNGTNSITKVKYVEVIPGPLCPDHDPEERRELRNKKANDRFTVAKWQIYPNPVRDLLSLRYGDQLAVGAKYQMMSSQGEIVAQGSIGRSSSLDLGQMTNGVYMLLLDHDHQRVYHKVVIMR